MSIERETRGDVTILRMDDGKANAVSPELLRELNAALDAVESDVDAAVLVLTGRPGRFSAGFDLSVMRGGVEAARSLVVDGGRLALRLYGFPKPLVAACTGHALALGAIFLLASDFRVGADGDFKIGLNEVAIGLTLPDFGVQLALERLSKRHVSRAAIEAEIYAPSGARDAGFLDEVASAESLLERALSEAKRLAALDGRAFAATKARFRGSLIERTGAGLEADIRAMIPG